MLHNLDRDRRLFVLSHSHGYGCLGFDVVRDRSERLVAWLASKGVGFEGPLSYGDEEAFEQYEALMALASDFCRDNNTRCDVELVPELVGLEGSRVEVVDCYGDKRRFIVGKSSGWMPCHLEILRRNSSGGGCVTGAPFKSVRVVEARVR